MSTSLHQVYRNFVWRLESISPAYVEKKLKSFYSISHLNPGETGGTSRGFILRRESRTSSLEPTNLYQRWAEHTYVLDVHYSREYPRATVEEIIAQDSHDIIRTLCDPDLWIGYDASHTTTDIGLKNRKEAGDQTVETESNYISRITFKAMIKEVEYA